MTIYLGLGANEGDRAGNINRAIDELVAAGFIPHKVSPLVESPALLPRDAKPDWHKPYLNLVVAGDAKWSPRDGLAIAKRIEKNLGRNADAPRWAPRPIDIDLLRWHCDRLRGETLTIPHADARRRDFVLTPLLHLQPDLIIGERGETVFELTQGIKPIPLWMAAVNITPDSFSDGGANENLTAVDAYLDKLIARNVQIIDIGGESTRPGAIPIPPDEEWRRVRPVLELLADKLKNKRAKPLIAIDSRNASTVEKSLAFGVDIINDVRGLVDADMRALGKSSGCQIIAMHSLSAPADASLQLPDARCAVSFMRDWIAKKIDALTAAGLDLNKIIVDPGIGFGKTAAQSFELLSAITELRGAGLRVLIGHSRKSLLANLTTHPPAQRDLETLGVSLALCAQGADIIRVHAPFMHQRAYLAWAHVKYAA